MSIFSFGLVVGLAGCASAFSSDELVECAAAGEIIYLENARNEARLNALGIHPSLNMSAYIAVSQARIARLRLHDQDHVSLNDTRLKSLSKPELEAELELAIADKTEQLNGSPRSEIVEVNRRCNRLVKQAVAEAE